MLALSLLFLAVAAFAIASIAGSSIGYREMAGNVRDAARSVADTREYRFTITEINARRGPAPVLTLPVRTKRGQPDGLRAAA